MPLRHFVAGLTALLCCSGAFAAQLGQLSTHSHLGETLLARIELYGLQAQDLPGVGLELRPEIGVPRGSAERRVVASITPTVAQDERGFPYVKLTSEAPISEPIVSFRVRLRTGAVTNVRHYTLALDPPAYRQTAAASDVVETAPAPVVEAPMRSYGPVRSGQTLWRIMKENGLTAGNTSATIERIVRDNPHAFVAGDANRLRIGVELSLPGSQLEAAPPEQTPLPDPIVAAAPRPAPAAVAPAMEAPTAPIKATAAPTQFVPDAATAARLKALEEKFAAIRARYEQQRQAAPAAPAEESIAEISEATSQAPSQIELATADSPASADTATPTPEIAATDITTYADTPAVATDEGSLVYFIIMIVVGALALIVKATLMMIAHRRRRNVHHASVTKDADLRAEIARKAEKRVQLESEVKRRIEDKRQEPAAVSANTVESTSDAAAINEAETQIAHGHYAEAETLLLNVIAQMPNNYRAKLRLAEIYYLNERRDDFVRMADVIYHRHREDIGDENWQRIMRMGKIIAPERAPFSGPAAIESETDPATVPSSARLVGSRS